MIVLFGPNADALLLVAVLTAFPVIVTRVRAVLAARAERRRQPPPDSGTAAIPAESRSPLLHLLTAIVILHSLYILFTIIFDNPSNIFSSLQISLATPSPVIRQSLLAYTPNSTLPPAIQVLLARLQSFDARIIYVRFGHNTVVECDYCHSFWDFALFSLPGVGIQYVRMAAVFALMTMRGSGKRKWRPWVVGAVMTAFVLEAWTLTTVDIPFPRNGDKVIMWHDRAWYTRQLFFLLSPILLHLLPYGYHPLSPLLSLPPTLHSFESTLASLQLLEHVRAASMRDESLRANVGEFWENEARQGEHARTDEELVQEASRMGMGYAGGGDTKLAEGAKAAVESMIAMLSSGSGSRPTTKV